MLQVREPLNDEQLIARERVLDDLHEMHEERVQRKREELRSLKRELQYLNVESTDLRRIFAAEKTRYMHLPRFWTLFVLLHLWLALEAWHRIRQGPYAEGGSSMDILFFPSHLILFLMFWRAIYYPTQKYLRPLSLWWLAVHYYSTT